MTFPSFEQQILQIVATFLGRGSIDLVQPFLVRQQVSCLGIPSRLADVLCRRLAQGTVQQIARRGYQRETFMEGAVASNRERRRGASSPRGATGPRKSTGLRVWERHGLENLRCQFSGNTAGFLVWCVAESGLNPQAKVPFFPESFTAADAWFRFLAYREARLTEVGRNWRTLSAFRQNAFCRCVFPADFGPLPANDADARSDDLVETALVDSANWFDASFLMYWEILQDELLAAWNHLESVKGHSQEGRDVLRIGMAQWHCFQWLREQTARLGRRDLLRFILRLGHQELIERGRQDHAAWCGNLALGSLSVAERIVIYEAAYVLPRAIQQCQAWTSWAYSIGFVDEQYEAAQFWKLEWERWEGARQAEIAAKLLRTLERLEA